METQVEIIQRIIKILVLSCNIPEIIHKMEHLVVFITVLRI